MKKSKVLIIFVSVLIICVFFACAPVAFATPAYVREDGRDALSLAASSLGNVVLESVEVVINADVFPEASHSSEEYTNVVTAEYTFDNLSDGDAYLGVLFSNSVPEYISYYDDYRKVGFDGAEAETEKRTTPVVRSDEDRKLFALALTSSYDPDADISPDAKVYVYRYRVTKGFPVEKNVQAVVTAEPYGVPIFADDAQVEGKYMEIDIKDRCFDLTTVGEPLGEDFGIVFSSSGDNYIDGVICERELVRETTVREWVFSQTGGTEPDKDIYACTVAKVARAEYPVFVMSEIFSDRTSKYDFVEVSVPKGGTTVMRVEEPFFPWIDEGYTPTIYPSTVCVPVAEKAQDFSMTVEVKTPYYIKSGASYVSTADGYILKYTSSANDGISFILCGKESYSKGRTNLWPLVAIGILIAAPFIILFVLVVPVAVLVVIVGGLAYLIIALIKLIFGIGVSVKDKGKGGGKKNRKGKKKDNGDDEFLEI